MKLGKIGQVIQQMKTEEQMDNFPKVGMTYEQGRVRARRFASQNNVKIVKSLVNQVNMAEGRGAANELVKEIRRDYGKQKESRKYFTVR